MIKLSKNLTYEEAISSQTAIRNGIDNTPNKVQLDNMVLLANKVFQPIRDHFNTPIRVSSFFRNARVNKLVGGSPTSQHTKGEAIDLQGTNGLRNSQIFEYIRKNLEFDQLIWEFGSKDEPAWVHVSLKSNGKNRKQVFAIGVKKTF